ncbi:TatD family hydrolase [Carboxydothermus ferrireducens]|uniref:TatD DNase family protein n=1 Tax=Carboxydothermus ferrireducens DSM 11255 TaxID=1119529 RepID=A0ABX2R9B8_9THEO|nr:TatD family hydrolase [Carboxydothermus ferrireducens]NYE57645.1 TatD DNase family protein [Carboxydothermus ferrireducens DSM 11255]
MLIDSHAHLNDQKFKDDVEEVIKRARQNGVEKIITVGYDLPTSEEAVRLSEKYPEIYAAVGIHPHDAKALNDRVFSRLEQLLDHPRVVALGEIGLDFYRDLSPREVQREAFIRQLKLAREKGKPVIIHDRDAHQEVFDTLKEHALGLPGVIHCFSGSAELALRYIKELNFYISLAGPLTFKNNVKGKEVAKKVPLEYLLVETDCPYLTPEPFRGRRNEPGLVTLVAEEIARIKGIAKEEAFQALTENTSKLFNL